MDPYVAYPLLAAGSLLAGVLNTVAGGGSFITLPLLVFTGLPAPIANGTNRLGIVAQNIFAVRGFRKQGVRVEGVVRPLLPATLLGTAIGAVLAARLDAAAVEAAMGAALVLVSLFLLRGGAAALSASGAPGAALPASPSAGAQALYFALGVYGGFVQAGVGVLLVAALSRTHGVGLVAANAVKVALVLVYTVLAAAVLVGHGHFDLGAGAAVALGQAAGGALGARLAVKRGERFVRAVIVAVGIGSGLEMLGVRRLLFS